MLNTRLWRHGPFLRFFIAASFSNVGNWFNTVAIAVLIYRLTGRVSTVAVAIALSVLPRALLGLAGGAVADRVERRDLLVILDAARAVVALLPLLAHDAASVWLVYAAVLLLQLGTCIYNPAQSAYVPHLVDDDLLEPANAAYASMRDVGMFGGPALAWAILGLWGPAAAFYGNALSFVVSAGLMLTLPRARFVATQVPRFGALIAGYVTIVRRYPRVAALYLCFFAAAVPIYFFQAIMVVYVKNIGEPTVFVGVLYCAAGLGGAIGGFLMGHYLRRLRYAMALAIYGLCIPLVGALALVHGALVALLLLALSTAAATAGDLIFTVSVQRDVAPGERGRAFGLLFWCVPIGQLLGALVAAGTTAGTALAMLPWVSACALPVVLAGGLLSIRAKPSGVAVRQGTRTQGLSRPNR